MSKQKAIEAMEYIWERLPKEKDGNSVRYQPGDIPYLYKNGFVDTKKWTYAQWKGAFQPHLQKDESYVLNKRQFMGLTVFRYNGPSHEPFDAKKLYEGAWSDERLKELYHKAIKPSSEIPEEIFWNSVKALKDAGSVNTKGELMVDQSVKTQLGYLIDRFPSARRRLEAEVTRLRKEKDTKHLSNQKNRDASGFSIGKGETEHKMEAFQKMQSLQTASPTDSTSGDDDDDTPNALNVKSMRRPSGRVRG